jgi:hypothetical protein
MVSFHSATHEGVRYLSMDVLQYVFQKKTWPGWLLDRVMSYVDSCISYRSIP